MNFEHTASHAAHIALAAFLCAFIAIMAMFALPVPAHAAKKGTPEKLVAVAKAEYKDVVATYGKGAQSYSTEVRLAKKYVEYVEGKGASPEPWCADFASYCLYKAGYVKLYGAGKHAYHHDFVLDIAKGTATGTVHKADTNYTPQVGDLVIRCSKSCGMDCGKGSSGQHVAIVCSVSDDGTTFKTYGGNESNTICKNSYSTSSNTWDWFVTYGQTDENACTHEKVKEIHADTWKGTRCKSCGHVRITQFCDGGLHVYKNKKAKAATCSQKGYTAYKKCTACGSTIGKTPIKKLAHTWGAWEHTQDLSCTTDEEKQRCCTVCGAVKTKTIAKATGHAWSSWNITKKATCTKDGSKTKTCKTCGKVKTKAIKATGHSYAAATCTTPKTCNVCGETSGTALGHSYKSVKAKAATCTKAGHSAYKKCTVCSKKKGYAKIAATGHSYDENGKCAVCGSSK